MTNRRTIPDPIGWPLLAVPDAQGNLSYPPSLDQSVRQMIRVILSTRPGEQLMRPRFGGGLTRFLEEPNTIQTRREIHDVVKSSLERWEPRIFLDRVEVLEVPGEPTQVRVEIQYRLRRTGAPQQLGLSMEVAA